MTPNHKVDRTRFDEFDEFDEFHEVSRGFTRLTSARGRRGRRIVLDRLQYQLRQEFSTILRGTDTQNFLGRGC